MSKPVDFIQIVNQQDQHKSKAEIKAWLENKIHHMLEHESDLLWSILYRMDIDEERIKRVMKNHHSVPVERGLAKLVLERQLQRNKIREQYSSSGKFYK